MLSKKCRVNRLKSGGITFNRQKIHFVLDENKKPTKYY